MKKHEKIDLRFNFKGIEEFPPILYKFRSWNNDFHKNVLTKQELFISDIKLLNDPFDGSIVVNHKINPVSKEDIKNMLGIEDNMPIPLDDIIARASSNVAFQLDRELEHKTKNVGILSLSSIKNNILLWSHYADGHTGFAIGFDTNKLSKFIGDLGVSSFIKGINYSKHYPKIQFEFNLFQKFDETMLFKAIIHSQTTKSDLWAYENEIRILTLAKNNFTINFPKECVKEIVLGFKMNNENIEEIKQICGSHYPHAEIFLCKKENSVYGVQFEKLS